MTGAAVSLDAAATPATFNIDGLRTLLLASVHHCVASGEFLVVEHGGWDAPPEPFCLFILINDGDGSVNVIETAPDPTDSSLWAPHVLPGRTSQSLSAPATGQTVDAAPDVMLEAIGGWGLQPWDLALTFGRR